MANSWQRWKGIMKCVPFEEKRLMKWKPPYIVQPKYDGVRCRAVHVTTGHSGDEYILLSSEENIIYSTPHINNILRKLQLRAELDGELYCHGKTFEEIVSITSRTVNLHPEHESISFHVFDVVNKEPQMRRTLLTDSLRGIHPLIKVAPFYLCETLDDIMRAYDRILNDGYEGIIVRNFLAPYVRKRSTMVMKFKPKKEDIYEIVSVAEEISINGTPKGTLGAIICRGNEGSTFSVGTGFSRAQREDLWKTAEVLPGKFIRVQYQHLTNKDGVPRFPVFMEVISDDK